MMATTRQRLLDAAERVLRTKGLAAASTREIAREAGCADGTLYNHFRDRADLFVAIFLEKLLPDYWEVLSKLSYRIGEGTVQAHLEELAQIALAFYYKAAPMRAALFAEPELLQRYREALKSQAQIRQQERPAPLLAAYLRAEQRLGRVAVQANPTIAAEALFGTCASYALRQCFLGESPTSEADRQFVLELVRSLMEGLSPREPSI
ncbi:MAG: TetR/AcrR family transcriptional regulator [Cyanobacteria bacterium CRU_2_1]|nr:TetR/AcrR family transcriptional regulator [Cyanobacteria bacterium RU_5_0]NJR59372.1 TetR/AcrR family transcriptional regulator [Cyanobacteria bacterium CRU_2_1]